MTLCRVDTLLMLIGVVLATFLFFNSEANCQERRPGFVDQESTAGLLARSRAAQQKSTQIEESVSVLLATPIETDVALNFRVQEIDSIIQSHRVSANDIQYELDQILRRSEEGRLGEITSQVDSLSPPNSIGPHHRLTASAKDQEETDQVLESSEKDNLRSADEKPKGIRKPIDVLAIANNLVQLGNFDSAAKIYEESLSRGELGKQERKWVFLQLARCYRETRQLAEAEKNLRAITQVKGPGPRGDKKTPLQSDVYSTTAAWWLDQMDRRRRIEDELNR